MNQLQQLLEKLKSFFFDLIVRIEESALFERLLSEYEALEPRQQKWMRALTVLLVLASIVLMVGLPIFHVYRTQRNLNDLRTLVTEMRHYQDEKAVIRKPAPPAMGFQNLPAGSQSEAEDSLKAYLNSIGLEGDNLSTAEAGGWTLSVPELSLRQASALLFQIDAWNPRLSSDNVRLSVHPEHKDLLAMSADIHLGAFSPRPIDGAPLPGYAPGEGDRSGGGFANPTNPNPRGGEAQPEEGFTEDGGTTFPGMPSSDSPSGFQSELPPPEFEEDL